MVLRAKIILQASSTGSSGHSPVGRRPKSITRIQRIRDGHHILSTHPTATAARVRARKSLQSTTKKFTFKINNLEKKFEKKIWKKNLEKNWKFEKNLEKKFGKIWKKFEKNLEKIWKKIWKFLKKFLRKNFKKF